LNRFFALHVVALPIVILGLVVLHILALHEVGSNNPDGVDIKKKRTKTASRWTAFRSTRTTPSKTSSAWWCSCSCSAPSCSSSRKWAVTSWKTELRAGQRVQDPEHIAPVWYFTPFYAILRAVPDKLMG
jgi:ubiquinol-cytochrome c reductase cytochrome b subunit